MLRSGGTERLPEGTIYVHTSHLRLDRPERFDWLYTRRDVRPVFFVHDLIPISHPEYGRPGRRSATRREWKLSRATPRTCSSIRAMSAPASRTTPAAEASAPSR
ncbi:hypothetical protein GCM10025880_22220 [Methylorubrum aminovorans]|nr:hypothetical protein GCM10025880_22220 [Methylorubrum aminovorans]